MKATLSITFIVTAIAAVAQDSDSVKKESAEIRRRLAVVMDSNAPSDELLTMSLQYSEIAVPILRDSLKAIGRTQKKLDRKAEIQADALAYVANKGAIDATAQLCVEDPKLFCPYLERTLDYAEGRVNPFTLAYHALEGNQESVRKTVLEWVRSVLDFPHFQQRLAEAVVSRYGRRPETSELLKDRLLSDVGTLPAGFWRELDRAVKTQRQ